MGILVNLVSRRLLLITTLQNVEMFALKYRLICVSNYYTTDNSEYNFGWVAQRLSDRSSTFVGSHVHPDKV